MFHLMTPRTTTAQRRARRFGRLVAQAVRSVVNPAALVKAEAAAAPVAESADLYTPDEMPAADEIQRAIVGYDLAMDAARSADRAKRKHRKLVGKLPSGTYNGWRVFRAPSSRQTPDLDAITVMYQSLGLPVPMKPCAPTLKVERVQDVTETTIGAELAGVAA